MWDECTLFETFDSLTHRVKGVSLCATEIKQFDNSASSLFLWTITRAARLCSVKYDATDEYVYMCTDCVLTDWC